MDLAKESGVGYKPENCEFRWNGYSQFEADGQKMATATERGQP
jgi:hypothetical protein